MSYREAIEYILSLQQLGIKLGLEKMQRMAGLFGNPERSFRCIHIAGTNGKGSVAAMCASLLKASGCRVGLYTSPHLVSFTERIRVDDEPIAESDVVRLADRVREQLAQSPDIPAPTFFEFTTLLAFLHFRERGIDWAVIETGMGGRLDATNIVQPDVTVLTRIGLDHQEYLGQTLAEIAREKAGIMKPAVPLISAGQADEVAQVLSASAEALGCPVVFFDRDFSGRVLKSGLEGIVIDYVSPAETIEHLTVPLAGRHQAENAAIAISAFRRIFPSPGGSDYALQATERPVSQEIVRLGMAASCWPGRLEVVDRDPLTIVDGAHNPAAATALAAFLADHAAGYRIALVLGILADKDIAGIMQPLLPHAAQLFLAPPQTSRAASIPVLAEIARAAGFRPHHGSSVHEALRAARDWSRAEQSDGQNALVLVTGSLYTVGEACASLGMPAVLGSLREHR